MYIPIIALIAVVLLIIFAFVFLHRYMSKKVIQEKRRCDKLLNKAKIEKISNNAMNNALSARLEIDQLHNKAYYTVLIQKAVQDIIDSYTPPRALVNYFCEDPDAEFQADVKAVLENDTAMNREIESAGTEEGKIQVVIDYLPKTIQMAIHILPRLSVCNIEQKEKSELNSLLHRYCICDWKVEKKIQEGIRLKDEEYEKKRNEEMQKRLREERKHREEEHNELMRIEKEISEKSAKLSHKSKEEIARETYEKLMQSVKK